jgi:hypothetical protein
MESKENIVWLSSYPKSGNTWLRVFLNTVLSKDGMDISINDINITDGIVSNRSFFERWVGVDSEELTKAEIDNYLPKVLMKRSANLKERSFVKTHTANVKNKNGDFLFPIEVTEKVIYIVRNPLDVCVSMAFHSGHENFDSSIKTINNAEYILADSRSFYNVQMHQYLKDWSTHYLSWNKSFLADKILVIKYEDMKLKGFETFSSILNFLEIEVNEDKLRSALKKCSFSNLKNQERKEGFMERPSRSKSFFRKGEVGGWRNYLSDNQVEHIIGKHKVVMEELGYIQSDRTLLI